MSTNVESRRSSLHPPTIAVGSGRVGSSHWDRFPPRDRSLAGDRTSGFSWLTKRTRRVDREGNGRRCSLLEWWRAEQWNWSACERSCVSGSTRCCRSSRERFDRSSELFCPTLSKRTNAVRIEDTQRWMTDRRNCSYRCLSFLSTENDGFSSDSIDHFENSFVFLENPRRNFVLFRCRWGFLLPGFRWFRENDIINRLAHLQKIVRSSNLFNRSISSLSLSSLDITISINSSTVVYWETAKARNSSSRPSFP